MRPLLVLAGTTALNLAIRRYDAQCLMDITKDIASSLVNSMRLVFNRS